ncbi:hypothetical protein O9K51_00157 [Purpureocillium lavendulum]|uniref:Uncharacterized protein n=1 Tax=Purpureocillium lavendulum TaxID=1247861 RepID=A0AB34G2Y5_9HYPO|nr:hypothetical protein O9K51_00157 [Purpureocillium lavendulum]
MRALEALTAKRPLAVGEVEQHERLPGAAATTTAAVAAARHGVGEDIVAAAVDGQHRVQAVDEDIALALARRQGLAPVREDAVRAALLRGDVPLAVVVVDSHPRPLGLGEAAVALGRPLHGQAAVVAGLEAHLREHVAHVHVCVVCVVCIVCVGARARAHTRSLAPLLLLLLLLLGTPPLQLGVVVAAGLDVNVLVDAPRGRRVGHANLLALQQVQRAAQGGQVRGKHLGGAGTVARVVARVARQAAARVVVVHVDGVPAVAARHGALPEVGDAAQRVEPELALAVLVPGGAKVHVDNVAGEDHVELVARGSHVRRDARLVLCEAELADGHDAAAAVAVVLVEDAPPHLLQVLVHARPAGEPLGARLVLGGRVGDGGVGQVRVLGHEVHRVDAEAVGAAVEPELHVGVGGGAHALVGPVEVGLRGEEEAEVVLLGALVPGPGAAAKDARPVVGGQALAAGAPAGVAPKVPAAFGPVAGGARLAEPGVLVARVVDDEVEEDAQAAGVAGGDEGLGVGERAVGRVDGAVVGHVVAHVALGAGEDGRQPDGRGAEVADVVEPRRDARDVAEPVAVGVAEAGRVDLVDDGVLPPGVVVVVPAAAAAPHGRRGHGDGCEVLARVVLLRLIMIMMRMDDVD